MDFSARLNPFVMSLEQGPKAIAPPIHLNRAVERVRHQFDKGQASCISTDRVEKAVRTLLRQGADALRSGQRYVLAHALTQPTVPLKGRSIFQTEVAADALLSGWELDLQRGRFRASHWRGLFHSYLQAEPSKLLDRLRRFLADSLQQVATSPKIQPQWLVAAQNHKVLLGNDPCRPYANALLSGNRELLDDLLRAISVPEQSWLWDSLLKSFLDQLDSLGDQEFRSRIGLALSLTKELRLARDQLLSRVLDRYARTADRARNDQLLSFALDAWGSPQLSRNSLWELVRSDTKQMVCGWLALEDLEDFYRLCQDEKKVDERRLKYWLRFKDQITFSQIVLGPALRSSRDPDVRNFRQRKKGRLAELAGTTSSNNAILMQIAGWLFVEFSETGNACYGYKVDRLPFALGSSLYSIGELRNPNTIDRLKGCRLVHRGDWEDDIFDPELRSRGLRPDSAMTQLRPSRVAEEFRAKPHITSAIRRAIPDRLLMDISRAGGAIADHRHDGGCLIVRLPRPDSQLDRDLRRAGFQWSRDVGYYLE